MGSNGISVKIDFSYIKTEVIQYMKPEVSAGRVAACEKLKTLFDAGTFAEFGELVTRPDSTMQEGVICGCGAVEGRLVYAYYEDISSLGGAVDTASLRKLKNLYAMAEKNGAPIVSYLSSAGASVAQGGELLAVYGELFADCARLSGDVLQISVVNGVCTGSQAILASMSDFVVAAGDHSLSFAPASVLKAEGGCACSKGISVKCANEAQATATVRKLISMLPSNCEEEVEIAADDVNRVADISVTSGASAAAAAVADFGALIEINPETCECITTYIAAVNGKACGFVAVNSACGAVAFRKAASMVRFCDAFGLPVVTFVNADGFSAANEAKGGDVATAAAEYVSVIANATTAKIAFICGDACGAAYTVFASKALYDVVYALEGSVISVMPPVSAVEFLKNDIIAASSNPKAERAALVEAYKTNEASPSAAAALGLIDAVISPADAVKYIAFAAEMMAGKRVAPSFKKCASK